MKQYIGIDIGGTKISVVKGDKDGNILKKVKFKTPESVDEAMGRILLEAEAMGRADAVGISCGGPLDSERGVILSPPNLPGWDNIPIVRLIEERLAIPAFLQNDADACALAEWRYGAGRGTRNMIFLTFGTGMGAGLILNGALYSGSCGMAGEVGHIAMEKDGPVGYGKSGSFEGFCSGGGIRQLAMSRAEKMLSAGETPSFCKTLEELEGITAQSVGIKAEEGYSDAMHIYEECGYMLGRGLAVLVDILNPQKIIIGSIYARSQRLIEPSMRRALEAEALTVPLAACEIVPAALGEKLGDIAALSVAADGMLRRN